MRKLNFIPHPEGFGLKEVWYRLLHSAKADVRNDGIENCRIADSPKIKNPTKLVGLLKMYCKN